MDRKNVLQGCRDGFAACYDVFASPAAVAARTRAAAGGDAKEEIGVSTRCRHDMGHRVALYTFARRVEFYCFGYDRGTIVIMVGSSSFFVWFVLFAFSIYPNGALQPPPPQHDLLCRIIFFAASGDYHAPLPSKSHTPDLIRELSRHISGSDHVSQGCLPRRNSFLPIASVDGDSRARFNCLCFSSLLVFF